MISAAPTGDAELQLWCNLGGEATLMSYCPFDDHGTLADVPDAHWDFLDCRLLDFYETDTHIYVHAGVLPPLPLDRQPPLGLRWPTSAHPPPHCARTVAV